MTIGNKTECQRLEQNYVVCQQYKTSLHMMQAAVAQRSLNSSQQSSTQISYRLTGTEIANNKLYLQTDDKPVLYIANTDGWAIEYPVDEVRQFVRGRGYAKKTFYLENSPLASFCYLIICLSLGILILRTAYYLDRRLVRQLFKS